MEIGGGNRRGVVGRSWDAPGFGADRGTCHTGGHSVDLASHGGILPVM
jgi:hypothetical protein